MSKPPHAASPTLRRLVRPGLVATVCLGVSACPSPSDVRTDLEVIVEGDGGGGIAWYDTSSQSCTLDVGLLTVDCRGDFTNVSSGSITFTAGAASGSVFAGWESHPSCGTERECVVKWAEVPESLTVRALFLLMPGTVTVTLSDDAALDPGKTVQATAEVTPPEGKALHEAEYPAEYTWASSDSTVAAISGSGAQVTVTALAPGTTEITAGTRGVASDPREVTVATPAVTYLRTELATVAYAFILDFDSEGNLFVGNTGGDNPTTVNALVRKVTPAGQITPFGDSVADPDAVLVDREGRIATLGANTVLATGAYDSQYSNNHVTEIKSDGSVTRPLIESPPPLLSNPSALAFLPDSDLLVGNYGNNTVSRVHHNVVQDALELTPFYDDRQAAPNALRSLAVVGDRVYVVTGSRRLTALDLDGTVIDPDVWPSVDTADPYIVAAGAYGSWEGYLIAAGTDGQVWRIDTQTKARLPVLTFATPILGLGVSPVDGLLYVMDGSGTIWKVTEG